LEDGDRAGILIGVQSPGILGQHEKGKNRATTTLPVAEPILVVEVEKTMCGYIV